MKVIRVNDMEIWNRWCQADRQPTSAYAIGKNQANIYQHINRKIYTLNWRMTDKYRICGIWNLWNTVKWTIVACYVKKQIEILLRQMMRLALFFGTFGWEMVFRVSNRQCHCVWAFLVFHNSCKITSFAMYYSRTTQHFHHTQQR